MKYKEMLAFVNFLNKTEGSDTMAWRDAINDINVLMEYMGPYQLPQGDGTYRPIEPAAYENINLIFDRAVTSLSDYLKEAELSNFHDEARVQLAKNFNKEFLAKSYIEFKNVKPSPNIPLRDAMETFRYENVELSSDDLQKVGGNMSSRIQLSVDLDGKMTRGVFTKQTAYNPTGQYGKILDDMEAKYVKFASFWNALDDMAFFEGGLANVKPVIFCNSESGAVYDLNPELKDQALEGFEALTYLSTQYPEINEEFQKYRNDPDFFNALFDFSIKADQLSTQMGINEDFLGLKPGANIDSRNSAMSSVANLLGVSDLIAKSKQLSVHMPDGTNQTGTFMEFVESKDITKLDSIDEMRVYGLDAYEGKEVKVQLANLQVLDYICGNVDRHLGNMLYKFDPNTHKLTNIKGIDNDASFFKRPLSSNAALGQLPSINQMRVIDEAMAQKLLSIDEGMLGATLHGYGLTEEEVNAAFSRLNNLKEAIRNAPTYDPEKGLPPKNANGLTIVKTEDWEKLSLHDLQADNNNFDKIIGVQQMLTTQDMVTQQMKQNAGVTSRALKSMLNPNNTKSLLDNARAHKPFMGTSQRYLNVLSALENYQNAPAPEDPVNSEGHAKWQRLNELKQAVDAYKQEKIQLGHLNRDGSPAREFSGKALSRIEDVDQIGKFADKLLEQRKLAKDADKNLHEAERKQNELNAFKSLSPEQQQIILDQRRAAEEELNQDLALRIQNDLAHDDHLMEQSDLDVSSNLSLEDANIGMN